MTRVRNSEQTLVLLRRAQRLSVLSATLAVLLFFGMLASAYLGVHSLLIGCGVGCVALLWQHAKQDAQANELRADYIALDYREQLDRVR